MDRDRALTGSLKRVLIIMAVLAAFVILSYQEVYAEPEGKGPKLYEVDNPEPSEIITPDMIPYKNDRSKRDLNDSNTLTDTYIPLVAIVIGFNKTDGEMDYDTYYNWGYKLFEQEKSLRAFYTDMSYGKFTFTPAAETCSSSSSGNTNYYDAVNDGVIHVKLDMYHYNWRDWDDKTRTTYMAKAFTNAISAASSYIDFPSFDKNNDEVIQENELAVLFIVAGYDSGAGINHFASNLYMRSHKWTINGVINKYNMTDVTNPIITRNGKKVKLNPYVAVSEHCEKNTSTPGVIELKPGRMGSIAHELGHYLGLPDLYDNYFGSDPKNWTAYKVDYLSLMGAGSWGHDKNGDYYPCSLDPWSRDQLQWANINTVSSTGTYNISGQDYDYVRSRNIYLKVPIPNTSNKEYYLLESRRFMKWDEGLGDDYTAFTKDGKGGIILWHIDQKVLDASTDGVTEVYPWQSSSHTKYENVNNTNHRPAVMPLFMENSTTTSKNTFIGNSVVYDPKRIAFFDKDLWGRTYETPIGREIDLPTYGTGAITSGPSDRSLSGVRIELLTDTSRTMQIRFIDKYHTHSWSYSYTDYSYNFCKNGGTYTKISKCTSCGQTLQNTYYGSGHPSDKIIGIPKKEPTCTSDGFAQHYGCQLCGQAFTDSSGTNEVDLDYFRIPATGHSWDEWITTELPDYDYDGTRFRSCINCGESEWDSIPHLDRAGKMGKDGNPCGEGAAFEAADQELTAHEKETDPAGSVFHRLLLRSPKQTKKTITLTWKLPSADRFVIYGSRCGATRKIRKMKTTKASTVTLKKVAGAGIKAKTYYKFVVLALDDDNNVIAASKMIHVATKGAKKRSNHTAVFVKKKIIKTAANMKKNGSLALKAAARKKKGTAVKIHVRLRYESTNKKIATVTKKGVIKALSKGTCYVYAYAQNGKFKKIKVVVK